MKLEVTEKGRKLALSIIALTLLYVLFLDILLLLAASIIASIMFYSFSVALLRNRNLKKHSKIEPGCIELKLVAGTTQSMKMKIENKKPLSIRVKPTLNFCKIIPELYKTNEELKIEISPMLAGNYDSKWLEVEILSPLNIFVLKSTLPFNIKLTVLPRVVPVAIKALELLATSGTRIYEIPVQTVGIGTEYFETREYIPGDDPKRVDWKATARLQKLMIKKFHKEIGWLINLIYDEKVAGPLSRDEAATLFLKIALSLTSMEIPYDLSFIGVNNEIRSIKFKDQRTALLAAIKHALDAVNVDYGVLYELVEAQSTKEALKLLKMIDKEIIVKKTQKFDEESNAIVITCLIGDISWLMDLHETLKLNGRTLMINVPSKTWLDSPNLEETYINYEKQLKILAMLKRRGIEVRIGKDLDSNIQELKAYIA